MTTDNLGHRLSGADHEAAALYGAALDQLQCYVGDPLGTIDHALEKSPGFVMGHAFRAWLFLLGTEPGGVSEAMGAHMIATGLDATEREKGHLAAIGHLIRGEWQSAGRVLEDVAIGSPHDGLALQAGHIIDYFRGDSRMLRDRIGRAKPYWDETMPGYHNILAMHAFGLEENAAYAEAEKNGRRSIELDPRNAWGQHAVAHVLEMQGRQREGIAFMRANPDAWSKDNFMNVHNWWHLALYHLDLGEIDEVLALFDGPIHGAKSGVVLDLVDASALLWRLHLRGHDVGGRWASVADGWASIAGASLHAFNDMHAMMAAVGAGRRDLIETIRERQCQMLENGGDTAMFVREGGQAAAEAIAAFGSGDYRKTIGLIRPIRHTANRFGGSHAQRDILDLTLIEAAFRAGDYALAAALASERYEAKPTSPLAQYLVNRAQAERAA